MGHKLIYRNNIKLDFEEFGDILECIYLGSFPASDKIEKNEMGWACGAYG